MNLHEHTIYIHDLRHCALVVVTDGIFGKIAVMKPPYAHV